MPVQALPVQRLPTGQTAPLRWPAITVLGGLKRIAPSSVVLAAALLPLWLAMVAAAAVLLVVMLVLDAGYLVIDALRPGPPPARRRWLTGALV